MIVVLLSIISNLTSTQITGSKDMSRHHRGVGMCQTLVYSAGFLSWLVFSKCNLTQKSSVHEQILLGLSLTLVWDTYLNTGIKTVCILHSQTTLLVTHEHLLIHATIQSANHADAGQKHQNGEECGLGVFDRSMVVRDRLVGFSEYFRNC